MGLNWLKTVSKYTFGDLLEKQAISKVNFGKGVLSAPIYLRITNFTQ